MGLARGVPGRVVMRLIAALVAAMQLVLVAAPALDADAGRQATAHVEEQGVRLHWTHDAAECAGCTVRHLAATPADEPALPLARATRAPRATTEAASPAARLLTASRQSRAPPAV